MHTISTDVSAGIVTVTYHGKIALAERTAVLEKLLRTFAGSIHRRLLVDFRGADPALEKSVAFNELVLNLSALEVLGCVVAYVGPPGHAFNLMAQALSPAQAFAFRRFVNEQQAIDWLRSHHLPMPLEFALAG